MGRKSSAIARPVYLCPLFAMEMLLRGLYVGLRSNFNESPDQQFVFFQSTDRDANAIGEPERFQGTNDDSLLHQILDEGVCLFFIVAYDHDKICLRRHDLKLKFAERLDQVLSSFLVELKRVLHEFRVQKSGNSGGLGKRTRLERQLDLEKVLDELPVRETVSDPYSREAVDL